MSSSSHRPRRSCLYMPASNSRALEKAKTLPADCVIFDLEDAVAPDSKDTARQQACDAIAAGGYGHREIIVRTNAADTPWFAHDIKSLCNSKADAILVPKISSADDVLAICGFMDQEDASVDTQLWVMIEMPLAVLNIREISRLAGTTRLSALVMGFNDLAKEMRAQPDPARTVFLPAMAQTVMAARANGLVALDSVYNDFKDETGFDRECQQASAFGFDGKTLIHPNQIAVANSSFAPSAEQVAEAQAIIAAFAQPANAGKGVITIDGKMTELLHLEQAQHLVALAEAIKASEASA